jgi:outer membrane protein assembly factor BamB
MKKIFTLTLLAVSVATLCTVSAQTLAVKWKTDTLLRVPESVLFDTKNNVLYVSNINGKSDGKDGNGFISQVAPDGKIKNLEWVKGLDAPKGLGLFKNTLYVADLTRVVLIDISTGKIQQAIDIEGAQFLNDVTVDAKGNVYISDSATGKIHKLANNKAELFFESKEFGRINGLLALKDALCVADFGNGSFYNLTWDKKLTKIGETAQGADGIVTTGKDEFLVSSWHGEVYTFNASGKAQKILDTKEQKISAADIEYDAKTKILYVPTFFANTVTAYTFSK